MGQRFDAFNYLIPLLRLQFCRRRILEDQNIPMVPVLQAKIQRTLRSLLLIYETSWRQGWKPWPKPVQQMQLREFWTLWKLQRAIDCDDSSDSKKNYAFKATFFILPFFTGEFWWPTWRTEIDRLAHDTFWNNPRIIQLFRSPLVGIGSYRNLAGSVATPHRHTHT